MVGQLERLFENWDQRDLSAERYAILFLEGLNLEVRLARRLVSVPVLAVLGVAEEGTKVRVSVRFGASEATSHCAGILIDPQEAGLPSDRQRADGLAVPKAYEAFVAKGTRLSAAVASSLGEAPTELAAVRLLGGWSLSARLGSGRATVIVRCLP